MTAPLAIVLGGVDVTDKIDFTSIVMQLAGSQETGSCDFDIVDEGLTVSADAESTLTVTDVGSADVLFGGFTRSPRVVLTSVGRLIHVTAYDFNGLLDRSVVVSDSRTAGESDADRLAYLMSIYGTQFSADYSQIATLKASLPAQKFIAITLRQAIERVLGQASFKAAYYVDALGRLNTYDRTVPVAAPFDIRIGSPGVGELSPEDWTHDRNTDNLANAIYVVGATAAGSGWFTDVTSIGTYGRRERFFNAPDSDTYAKASQVGLAVLGDQKDPIPRAAFTTKSPNDGWRIGQSTTVNSVQDNLTNVSLRIAKVSTHYLNGTGDREYAIELGAPQATLSALLGATHGGGGGFPWHSPGGAGAWLPVQPTGTTVGDPIFGGTGCGCPPFIGPSVTLISTESFLNQTANWRVTRFRGVNSVGSGDVITNLNSTTPSWIATLEDYPFSSGHAGVPYERESRVFVSHDAPALANFATLTCRAFGDTGLSGFYAVDDLWQLYVASFDPTTGPIWNSITTEIDAGQVHPNSVSGSIGDFDSVTFDIPVVDGKVQFALLFAPSQSTVNGDNSPSTPFISRARYPAFSSSWSQSIDQLSTAYPTAYNNQKYKLEFKTILVPGPGQPIPNEIVGTGDGSTVAFTTAFPYEPGSLKVFANTEQIYAFTETDPATGAFTVSTAPFTGEEIRVDYQRARA